MTASTYAPTPAAGAVTVGELTDRLEHETSLGLRRISRRMQSGCALPEAVSDLRALYAHLTVTSLKIELTADVVASRPVIAAATRRLGQIAHTPAPSAFVRPEELW